MSWTRFHQPAKKLSSFLIRNGCHKLASLEPAASQLRLFSLTDPQFGAQGKSSSEIYQHSMAPSEFQFRFHGTSVSNQKQPEQPVQRLFQNSQPKSLKTEKPFLHVEPKEDGFLSNMVLTLGGFYSKESRLIRGSNSILKMTLDHCDHSGIREVLGLEDDFRTRHAFLCLHVWMICRRLRRTDMDGKQVLQQFYDGFQHEVEMRVHGEGVRVRVSKWLRQLEDIFFGSSKAYDEAIDKQTEDFADVLYRNVYGGKGDRHYCSALARYTLRELVSLSMTDDESVLKGAIKFNNNTD